RADKQNVAIAEVVSLYTAGIDSLIKEIGGTSEYNSGAGIAKRRNAYLTLVEEKELAGQERALVTAGFAGNTVDAPRLHAVLERINKQAAYLDLFRKLAAPAERDSLTAALGKPAAREVERLRKRLLERADSGGFDVDPAQWFAIATE